jgi:4-amino-4-deoxy-L-arabinose transferase-like glycosyltransferase
VAFLGLAALAAARIAYLWATPFDLAPDEAYHWDWSRHLDIAYRTKGPLVAWVIAAARAVGGDLAPVVRLPAALASVATVGAIALLAARLYSQAAGWIAGLALAAAPLFVAQGLLVTTDPFLAAAWALGALALWHATHGRPAVWWGVGAALAVGLLAKYTMIAFVPGMLAYVATRPDRPWRGASLALAVGLLGLAPPVVWNLQHDWATLRHLADFLSPARASGRPAAVTAAEFVASQFGVLGVSLFVGVLVALWRETAAAVRGDDRGRFVAWLSWPLLLAFLGLSLHTRVQANWAFPGYLVAFAALGGAAAAWCAGRTGTERLAGLAALLGLPVLVTALGLGGVPPAIARALPPKVDTENRLRGWSALGAEVGRRAALLRPDGRLFLAGANYQVTAELAFYVPGHPTVYCPSTNRGPNQYDYWPGPEGLAGWDALYVNADDGRLDPGVRARFEAVQQLPPVVLLRHGRPIRIHAVFLLRGYRGA